MTIINIYKNYTNIPVNKLLLFLDVNIRKGRLTPTSVTTDQQHTVQPSDYASLMYSRHVYNVFDYYCRTSDYCWSFNT